jgi:lytic murein transglycosylase
MIYNKFAIAIFTIALLITTQSALAASCGNKSGGFNKWKKQYRAEAAAQGIKSKTLHALDGVKYDKRIIRIDRNQKSFKMSFAKFYKLRAAGIVKRAKGKLKTHSKLLAGIEKKYGVSKEVIVSIWGLESVFGEFSGKSSIVRSLATLAYDCRRGPFFTNELTAALKIIQRGDIPASKMIGGPFGEIGQTQFLATSYIKYAVDGDGNGRRDLIHSTADVLASTASYLHAYGWQRGASWDPDTANYNVIKQWNKAGVYQKTIAKMANAIR